MQGKTLSRMEGDTGEKATPEPAEVSGRKERIVEAAVRLFSEKGYHETSIQDIADAAGLGKSSLYHYIESKDQLLFEIHESFVNQLLDRLLVLAASDLPPQEKLEAIIVDAIVATARYKPSVTVFFEEMRALSPEGFRRIVVRRDLYEQTLTGVIQAGIESGTFAVESAKLASLSLLGMINWAHRWLRADGPRSPEDVGRQMAQMMLNGLVARGA